MLDSFSRFGGVVPQCKIIIIKKKKTASLKIILQHIEKRPQTAPAARFKEDSMSKSKLLFFTNTKRPQRTRSYRPEQLETQSPYSSFEYEDISFSQDRTHIAAPNAAAVSTTDLTDISSQKPTDILARESDVIISTQITPLTEYKGFALYLTAGLFHGVWLLWTFLPKKWLNMIGVYYYPSRWWSISISSFVLMLMLSTYIGIQLKNIEYETVKLDDLRTIIDDDAVVEKDYLKYKWRPSNGVHDLRITDVNKILYDDDELK